MPFCQITLKAQKPLSPAYPQDLRTLGDHLRKRRLDLKLLQKDVAKRIGADTKSVCNWENNRTTPEIRFLPKIIEFLGYVPQETEVTTLGERIVMARRLQGLSQKTLAQRLGIDPSTLGKWERDRRRPSQPSLAILNAWFTSLSASVAGCVQSSEQSH